MSWGKFIATVGLFGAYTGSNVKTFDPVIFLCKK